VSLGLDEGKQVMCDVSLRLYRLCNLVASIYCCTCWSGSSVKILDSKMFLTQGSRLNNVLDSRFSTQECS